MGTKLSNAVAVVAALLLLGACSETKVENKAATEAKNKPAKPSEPVSGKTAFYEMYKPARAWATDLLPLSLASDEVPGMKNDAGKAAMWTAVFVSPSKREARTLTYSVTDQGSSIRKGVSMGGAQVWSGQTAKSRPFQITEFAADSDAAYQAALEKAGAWVKKHPEKTASLYLGNAARFPGPVWYVLWGDQKTGYGVFVNATTGAVAKSK